MRGGIPASTYCSVIADLRELRVALIFGNTPGQLHAVSVSMHIHLALVALVGASTRRAVRLTHVPQQVVWEGLRLRVCVSRAGHLLRWCCSARGADCHFVLVAAVSKFYRAGRGTFGETVVDDVSLNSH